jgi:serine phosphatase RsbU (regulator of sigma subunit)
VSGDFYDGFAVTTDTWALNIGDVCGKGAAAAAATAMARWTLRSSLEQGASPEQALRSLNSVMLGRRGDRRFITALCMTVRVGRSSARVEIAAAGHPPPILVRAGSDPQAVEARGDLLGVFETIRLSAAVLELDPGDALVAYTDGVTDQGPGQRESPEEALSGHAGSDAGTLVAALERLAQNPPGPHPDDIAILALRFLGSREPTAAATPTGI